MKVVLDIETIPCDEQTTAWLSTLTEDKKSQVLKHSISNKSGNGLAEDLHRQTALDATFGRIFCIGLLALENDLSVREGLVTYGENEGQILTLFWRKMEEFHSPYLITHNGLSFDLPFIWKRSVIMNIKPTMEFNLRRFSSQHVYDTMAVWANWDARSFIKLDTLACALGVGRKSGSSTEVYDLWKMGKYQDIADYCSQDVFLTYSVYCKMNFAKPLPKDKLCFRFLRV